MVQFIGALMFTGEVAPESGWRSGEQGRERDPGISFPVEEGMTKQEFRDECDINVILRRYVATGVIEHVNALQGMFADVSDIGSFEQHQEFLLKAQASFDALPSSIRDRFANSPGKLLEFLAEESNRDEAVKLGLVKAPEPPAAAPAAEAVPTK